MTAIELCKLNTILEVPVTPQIQLDYVTSKFLVRDIDVELPREVLAEEISQKNLTVANIWRFTKKGSTDMTDLILVIVYGKELPLEIVLFCSSVDVQKFVGRVLQCQKCFKFTHSQNKCKLISPLCKLCGEPHDHNSCKSAS